MYHSLDRGPAQPGVGDPDLPTHSSPHEAPFRTADTCVVRVEGDLDSEACPALERALAPFLAGLEPMRLVMDLSAVSATDSAGLGLLVRTQAALRKRGGTMALTHCSPSVVRALEVTCLIQLFEVVP